MVLVELLDAGRRERVMKHLVEHLRRDGGDVGAHAGGLHHVHRGAHAGGQHLGVELGRREGLHDLGQVAEAVHYFIVRRTGIAFWDRGLGLKVHYQPIHWSRVLLPLAFMVLVVGTLLREPYNEMTREIIDEVTRGAGGAGSAAESEVVPEIP